MLLHSYPTITCIEGPNGVGKTSLVNVASFTAFDEYYRTKTGQLLIPCVKAFQLDIDKGPDEFKFEVLLSVAQSLIRAADWIPDIRRYSDFSGTLKKLLNDAEVGGTSFSIADWFSFGKESAPNESKAFETSGLEKLITDWLKHVFPTPDRGGVVCLIDNLEVINESKQAKTILEKLRDSVLTMPGLRWVICGANGIVSTAVSSPRLDGFLGEPMRIDGVSLQNARHVLESRRAAFARPELVSSPYLPITDERFETLYLALNRNLRHTLGEVSNYCMHVATNGSHPESDSEKNAMLDGWFSRRVHQLREDVEAAVTPRAWKVFDLAARDLNGSFSPSEFTKFGFESQPALRAHVGTLEENGLVVTTREDSDKRLKTVVVTSKGWLVNYARVLAGK